MDSSNSLSTGRGVLGVALGSLLHLGNLGGGVAVEFVGSLSELLAVSLNVLLFGKGFSISIVPLGDGVLDTGVEGTNILLSKGGVSVLVHTSLGQLSGESGKSTVLLIILAVGVSVGGVKGGLVSGDRLQIVSESSFLEGGVGISGPSSIVLGTISKSNPEFLLLAFSGLISTRSFSLSGKTSREAIESSLSSIRLSLHRLLINVVAGDELTSQPSEGLDVLLLGFILFLETIEDGLLNLSTGERLGIFDSLKVGLFGRDPGVKISILKVERLEHLIKILLSLQLSVEGLFSCLLNGSKVSPSTLQLIKRMFRSESGASSSEGVALQLLLDLSHNLSDHSKGSVLLSPLTLHIVVVGRHLGASVSKSVLIGVVFKHRLGLGDPGKESISTTVVFILESLLVLEGKFVVLDIGIESTVGGLQVSHGGGGVLVLCDVHLQDQLIIKSLHGCKGVLGLLTILVGGVDLLGKLLGLSLEGIDVRTDLFEKSKMGLSLLSELLALLLESLEVGIQSVPLLSALVNETSIGSLQGSEAVLHGLRVDVVVTGDLATEFLKSSHLGLEGVIFLIVTVKSFDQHTSDNDGVDLFVSLEVGILLLLPGFDPVGVGVETVDKVEEVLLSFEFSGESFPSGLDGSLEFLPFFIQLFDSDGGVEGRALMFAGSQTGLNGGVLLLNKGLLTLLLSQVLLSKVLELSEKSSNTLQGVIEGEVLQLRNGG
mmetsp:Transcript_27187/g.42326  ORF Transcript_27187/g.42326 Transcript_27187/m.42326 type:complete len:714 (-) Transcript_27187:2221-4362(-)